MEEIIHDVEAKDAIKRACVFVDVRTREEFLNFHIPKSYNVPLFTKEEKEFISKIYREKGEKSARFEAVKIVSPKIYSIVKEIEIIKKRHKNVAVYCWRGGLRSLSVVSFCGLAGVFVFRLKGGYRAFRNFILEDIKKILQNKKLYVLYGPTGVGKTAILRNLKKRGLPVIDLEGLAGHRGSVFGSIGLKQPSQKMFDALLWRKLKALENYPFIIVEGESKRIGNIYLPEPFWEKMLKGVKTGVSLSIDERVKFIMEEYGVDSFPPDTYISCLEKIKRYLKGDVFEFIKNSFENREYVKGVKFLIENYYDRLYGKSMSSKFDFFFEGDSVKILENIMYDFFLTELEKFK